MRNTLGAIWRACLFIAVYIGLDIWSGPEARYKTIVPVWHPAARLDAYAVLRYGKAAIVPMLAATLLAAAITPAVQARPLWSPVVGLLPLPMYVVLDLYMWRFLPGSASSPAIVACCFGLRR